MTSREQLKQCQSSWSAFTTRQERAAELKGYKRGLRRAIAICERRAAILNGVQAEIAADLIRSDIAIELASIPKPPTEPVVREGLRPTSSVSHGKQYAKKPPQG